MIALAEKNNAARGYTNVSFRQGDIQSMPLEDGIADVVVSNCVLNLVPDKNAVMADIFRVLKKGGHFSISDIVLNGTLPAGIREAVEMYAGCVSGAIQKETYMELISANGFTDITIQKEKDIIVPDDILARYLSAEEIARFRAGDAGIRSVTVFARKPEASCCAPGCCN